MKMRLLLTILALVILPTALLSLMASYAIRSRELVIQEQLKTAAGNTIYLVAGKVRAALESEALKVRTALTGPVIGGAAKPDIERAVAALKAHGLVEGVFVFMNPWGFIYPEEPVSADGKQREDQSLILALRRAVAGANQNQTSIMLTQDDVSYCFVPFGDRKDLFAGFAINDEAFHATLDRVLAEFSGKDIVLRAEGPGMEKESALVVEDSFGSARLPAEGDVERGGTVLAAGRLGRPFEHIRITALLKDPDEVIRAGRFQSRLLGWGILLLAAGICGGVLLVVGRAVAEVRRAAARGEYVIGVSHDLRTPLASMKMLAESLYHGTVTDPEKKKKFLSTIVGECDRLNRMIERVLFFVRFGQDALVYTMRTVNMGRLVGYLVDTFFVTSAGELRAGLKHGLKVAPGLPEMQVDDNAISQVIFNLLDNAVKYGRKTDGTIGEIMIEVDVVKRRTWFGGRSNDWLRISVTDQGMGISRRDQKRIFRSFYRSAAARKSNLSGVGLGLSLSQHIVRAHGGRLEVASEPGKGSKFTVLLPVGKAHKA